ncbi:nitrate ABC transporter substrate-binding protein [Desertihabitans brevis]|uniref:Nitrate ABC transporter substrate-binding protein n=1 Tax=Desertihabitans brevis TaxID=2268447 RepID=A0A367YZR1_9ACTN|nr:ABC transporter substrate-binding protein [Desertihabitans brevis]RCK71334.1 nitrate ABC transporter substrate-binding protein [Desertihabitans brevis]
MPSRAIRLAIASAAALTLTLLPGCQSTEPDAAAEGPDGLTPVSVGTINAILSAPLFLGIEEGIFAEHGLDLEVNFADGGAAVIPSVLSGDNEFGYSNTVSQLAAIDGGLPLTFVHSAWAPCCSFDEDDHGVLVRPDSGITEPADLEGANIAVNTLHNIGEVHIRLAFADLGLDDSTLTWTQLPFSDMTAALERGDVDAIWVSEPFLTPGLDAGFERVLSPGVQSFSGEVSGYYSTSDSFAAANPEVVSAFSAAMTEVNELAEAEPERLREAAVEEMGYDAETMARVNVPGFPNDDGLDALRRYADASAEYGIIQSVPDDLEALFATS